MPVYSRSKNLPNIIKNPPNLPIPIQFGELVVNGSFEDYPTATATYEGIIEKDLRKFETIYQNFNRQIYINGIPFRVAPDGGYNYDREGHLYKGSLKINVYKVTINFESWWKQLVERPIKIKQLIDINTGKLPINRLSREANVNYSGIGFDIYIGKDIDINERMSVGDVLVEYARVNECYVKYDATVSIEKINNGSGYSFSWEEQETDGTNTLGIAPYFNGAELTWSEPEIEDKKEPEDEEDSGEPPPLFEPVQPEVKVEIEGDLDPSIPPKDTVILRDLSSNFDQSGPTKTLRTTTTISNKVDKEVIEIWGFMYLWSDGVFDSDGYWSISSPDPFWKMIEYTETVYKYEPVPNPIFTINTAKNTTISKLVIHPDYNDYVKLVGVNNVEFNLGTIEYLTEVSVSPNSWKMVRLIQESDFDGQYVSMNMEPDDPFLPLIKWKKVQKYEVTKYFNRNAGVDYKSNDVPYSVEWSLWQDLTPEMRQRISVSSQSIGVTNWGTADNLEVGLIIPDLNFVPTYLTWVESSQNSSIIMTPHPDSLPPSDPIPPLLSGSEGYFQSKWKKIDEEFATQYNVEFSAQDGGFNNSAQRVSFKTIEGRPSEADYRHLGWQEANNQAQNRSPRRNTNNLEPNRVVRYFLYSDNIPKWAGEGLSASFSVATSKNEALKAAKTELIIQTLQSTQETRNLTWYLPQIQIMDSLNFEEDRFKGIFKVMNWSYTIKYDSSDNIFNLDIIATCDGTNVTLGRFENRSLSIEEIEEPVQPNDVNNDRPQNQGEEAQLETNQESFYQIGSILPLSVPSRRNYKF